MLVIAWMSARMDEQAGKGLADSREVTSRSGYRAKCDEGEIENDYIKQISGSLDERLR
jgi:hypothetical protein